MFSSCLFVHLFLASNPRAEVQGSTFRVSRYQSWLSFKIYSVSNDFDYLYLNMYHLMTDIGTAWEVTNTQKILIFVV